MIEQLKAMYLLGLTVIAQAVCPSVVRDFIGGVRVAGPSAKNGGGMTNVSGIRTAFGMTFGLKTSLEVCLPLNPKDTLMHLWSSGGSSLHCSDSSLPFNDQSSEVQNAGLHIHVGCDP